MNDIEINRMNEKLDVLFSQIDSLQEEQNGIAERALSDWSHAKKAEFFGLGKMEYRSSYKNAYDALSSLGLDVSGMIKPSN